MVAKRKAPNLDGQGTTTRGDMQCSYVSPTFGRCRYYGTIRTHRTDKEEAPGYCRVHYFDRSSAEAEQACEASQSWRPPDPDAPDPDREARLEALCLRYGVPVDMERPLREQTLIKAMCKDRPMAGTSRSGPNLAHMNAVVDAAEGKGPPFPRRPSEAEITAARRATGRGGAARSFDAMKPVTPGHGAQCVCQICYPKRVRTTPEFSK